VAGTASLRVDAFVAWLGSTGTPDDIAAFSRSIVSGLVSLAGNAKVAPSHVASGVELARDAGLDVAAMERLGTLLVTFEAIEVAQPSTVSIAFKPKPVPVPVPVPVPDSIVVAKAEAEPEQPKPKAVAVAAAAAAPTRSRAIPIAALALAIVALAWFARPGAAPDAEIQRLAALELPARFPPGWQLATRAPTPTPHGKVVLVERGALQAFVAVLPPTASAPLVAIREAEAGASAQLGAGHAVYFSEGCKLVAPRAARCRGTATDGVESRVVLTHLRTGARRVVVAVFVEPSLAPSDAELDAIAASLDPDAT
jgi:hypothetical protein